MPRMKCKHCDSDKHTSFNCWLAPKQPMRTDTPLRTKKRMNKIGKVSKKWVDTRTRWLELHRGEYFRCFYCECPLTEEELTLDHYKSRSREPHLRNDLRNLVPCCAPCNQEKGSRSGDEYIAILSLRKELA